MANDAVVLSVVVEAVPGREDELAEKLKALVEPTRAEPGCLAYHLHVSSEEPGKFLFYESFASQAALDEHIHTTHFEDYLKYREGNDPVAGETVMRWTPLQ